MTLLLSPKNAWIWILVVLIIFLIWLFSHQRDSKRVCGKKADDVLNKPSNTQSVHAKKNDSNTQLVHAKKNVSNTQSVHGKKNDSDDVQTVVVPVSRTGDICGVSNKVGITRGANVSRQQLTRVKTSMDSERPSILPKRTRVDGNSVLIEEINASDSECTESVCREFGWNKQQLQRGISVSYTGSRDPLL